MTTPEHVTYPHTPGYLFDCPACESRCHCEPGSAECVYEGQHNGNAGSDDLTLAMQECQAAQAEQREISDACARVIAALYQDSEVGAALATTGAIIASPDSVWCSLFGGLDHNGYTFYAGMGREQLLADMLGTYLIRAGKRGPVPGWSKLWIR